MKLTELEINSFLTVLRFMSRRHSSVMQKLVHLFNVTAPDMRANDDLQCDLAQLESQVKEALLNGH